MQAVETTDAVEIDTPEDYCGTLNKARDRKYVCKSCGHITHRDRLGAINIMKAPVVDGVA